MQDHPAGAVAARRFADRWQETYPKASLACVMISTTCDLLALCHSDERKRVRTTNAIERRSARCDAEPQQWASLRSNFDGPHPVRRVQSAKTETRASAPLSP